MSESEELIEIKNPSETINTSMDPPQASSSEQDKQLEETVPSVSTEDVGDSTLQQQSPVHTYEQYVEIALQQVSDFMLEKPKSPENEEHQSQLPQSDKSMDQQNIDEFGTEISEPELLDCLVNKLEEIISSQEEDDKKQDNLTENEVSEKLQLQFDKPNNNTQNLSTLSQDLFLSDSSQKSPVEQATNLESDIVISDVHSLEKMPVKHGNEIETEEEIWNEDEIQELQELEELGYNVVVPTQPKTQDSVTSAEAEHESQTRNSTASLPMSSSQESNDQIKLNVQICSIPMESLKPLFNESNDMMLLEPIATEKSPMLFTSDSSQDSQFENDELAGANTESNIIISNVCSLSTNVVNTTKNIDDKNMSQDSFVEILDDDFAKQLQELEEFGYEVVAPIQSEIDNNESHDEHNSQPSKGDISSKNKIHGSASDVAQDTKTQQTDMSTMMQDGDQLVDVSITNSINTPQKSFEPLLSSQEINTQTKDTSSQDSCITAMSENKTGSGGTQNSESSSKKGSSTKISDIIDEYLDSYADEIDIDDMDHVDMNTDCDLIPPHQLVDRSTSNLTKSLLHSNKKPSQCHEDQICFSNSQHDKELKDTADLLIGKQPFCSEIKIAIPKEAIPTEACLPNPCSTISTYSTDTATLPEQSSSASMPTESLTASNTTLSIDSGKDSSKKTRSIFIQTDVTPVDTMATQTEQIGGSDMATQTSLTMQYLDDVLFETDKEENKPQNKIRTRSATSKEWTENTDPETNSSQSSYEGLSINKRAKQKCTQEPNLPAYPRTRKPLIPFSNDQKIATIYNESTAKKDMGKTAQKLLLGERKMFKERISTSVGRKTLELPRCKERRVSSLIHNSDSSSPSSSGKNSPISLSPMIYQRKGSPDSSDLTSSPEQKSRKGKKSQEQVMQASYSAGSSSPPEAKKKKLSQQGECSMGLRSEPQQEPARKGLRLGLSRCAKLKSLLKN